MNNDGLIGIGEKVTDWTFGSNVDVADLIASKSNIGTQPKWEYNQNISEEFYYMCTIVSAFTELSYLFDRQYSYTEMLEVKRRMLADGKFVENVGAYLSEAIDYVRRWQNEQFPESQVESYQISYLDERVLKALNKNVRLTQLGYRTSSELKEDCQDNGYAGEKDYIKGGGHAASRYGKNIIDQYKGVLRYNRYSFKYFEFLIKNGVIYEKGYIFLRK